MQSVKKILAYSLKYNFFKIGLNFFISNKLIYLVFQKKLNPI